VCACACALCVCIRACFLHYCTVSKSEPVRPRPKKLPQTIETNYAMPLCHWLSLFISLAESELVSSAASPGTTGVAVNFAGTLGPRGVTRWTCGDLLGSRFARRTIIGSCSCWIASYSSIGSIREADCWNVTARATGISRIAFLGVSRSDSMNDAALVPAIRLERSRSMRRHARKFPSPSAPVRASEQCSK